MCMLTVPSLRADFYPEYDVNVLNALFAAGEMNKVRTQLNHDMQHFVNEVSEDALMDIIDKMCACAVRAQKAGVDVIQVHGDRLVGALCSTQMNTRTDKFGGSLENRTRFALMLVEALKKVVPDMIIDYKLSVVTPERGKGGVDEIDAPEFAQWLEAANVDMLHVGQANHTGNMADTIPPMGVQLTASLLISQVPLSKRFPSRLAPQGVLSILTWVRVYCKMARLI